MRGRAPDRPVTARALLISSWSSVTVVPTPWSLSALAPADPHGSGVLARTEGSVAVARHGLSHHAGTAPRHAARLGRRRHGVRVVRGASVLVPPVGYRMVRSGRKVPSMPSDRLNRDPLDLQRELEGAVERNEFGVEYQPIIDLQSGAIAAVEALIRWRHPLLGTIPPGDYLPLAEQTGPHRAHRRARPGDRQPAAADVAPGLRPDAVAVAARQRVADRSSRHPASRSRWSVPSTRPRSRPCR